MGMQTSMQTELFTRSPDGFHRRGLLDGPLNEQTSHGRWHPLSWSSQSELLQAFVGYAQSQLLESTQPAHRMRSAGPMADRALDWLRRCGFSIEDVNHLQFGLYTTSSDVELFLTSVGFVRDRIANTRLGFDFSPMVQHEWTGCLVVPMHDRFGEIVDLGFVNFDGDATPTMRWLCGANETGIVAYGLHRVLAHQAQANQTKREALIFVNEVIDAASLQCRGFENVAAVGALEEMSPHRWEALFDLGFARVDLVFRNRAAQQAQIRHFLTTRNGATRCPEVHVFDSTQFGPGESASEFVTRQGSDAFRRLLEGRAFVRRQWVEPEFGHRLPQINRQIGYAFQPERFWEAINHRLHAVGDPADNIECQHMADEVAQALMIGDFDGAHHMLDLWPIERWQWSAATSVSPRSVIGMDAALDAVCSTATEGERFHWSDRSSTTATSDVTLIQATGARQRTERLIEILLNDVRADDDGLSVVVCDNGLQRFITLLIHEMVRKQSKGCGLSISEVAARLRGDEPSAGFRDKPWLVDEAVDQLHDWSDRLCFIDQPHTDRALFLQLEDLHLENGPLGGIYLDLTDETAAEHGGFPSTDDSIIGTTYERLARDFDCTIVAAVSGQPTSPRQRDQESSDRVWRRSEWVAASEKPTVGPYRRDAQDFRALLRHWIVQTERRTRFEPDPV